MALEGEQMRTAHAPKAVFMAFGTQGDVLPLAKMCKGLAASGVMFIPISTPPVLTASGHEGMVLDMRRIEVVGQHQQQYGGNHGWKGSCASSFEWKKKIEQLHREECFHAMERVFSSGSNNFGNFIAINFFALEGWHLAEMYSIPCVVTAPYVVPYSAPASFERQFHAVYPLLYKRLQQALPGEVGWNDVMHWMWPLFTDRWTEWRLKQLHLSACPLTDPITELPVGHRWPAEPLLLYGFSKEVVECPSYWPPSVHVCGFWFPPQEWETLDGTCSQTGGNKVTGEQGYDTCSQTCGNKSTGEQTFSSTGELHYCPPLGLLEFITESTKSCGSPIFIGLSSIGSMGFLDNPEGMLCILKLALEAADKRGILFTAAYGPLEAAVLAAASEGGMNAETHLTSIAVSCKSSNGDKKIEDMSVQCSCQQHRGLKSLEEGILLFNRHLFCFSGSVPYLWLFPKCSLAIHHGGSGTTAAALHSGIPQVICPFVLDQFYWAERMAWIGVAPQPLRKQHLVPDGSAIPKNEALPLLHAIQDASSDKMRACATLLGHKVRAEDGIGAALNILCEKVCL